VRDLYARLMRYDFAAREFRRIETGARSAPGDYLITTLHNIRTQPWTGQTDEGTCWRSSVGLLWKGDDPCHSARTIVWPGH